jgi:colanic acid/amylovoran biosynthesis glycosyltransferase
VTKAVSTQARPRVVIFRNELLPASETFIRAQAAALQGFEPLFAGVHGALRPLQLDAPPLLLDGSSSHLGKLRRRLFWNVSCAPGFYREMLELHPVLVHAHFAIDGAAALPIARRLQVPLVVTLHGYDVTSSHKALSRSPEGRVYLRRRKRLWEQASIFVCVSRFIRDQALARGFPREKLEVLHTGVDLSLFRPSETARDPNLIVFVGRLVEKKGLRHLLDAFEIVRQEHPAAHLVCIGAGPLESELRERVAASGLRCEFLGSQPQELVKRKLAEARVLCVPSVRAASGDSEGLGMVFAEAQAMGTPVVSFQHGGIPEVVRHGHTGLLAPEGDSAALAQHLLRLLRDDVSWKEFSDNGRQWVREAFDLARQTRGLEEIYRRVLRSA